MDNWPRIVDWYRTRRDDVRQGRAVDELQDESLRVFGILDSVDASDVGMVERGQQLGFALETCQPFRVLCKGFRKNLDGDVTSQARVAGAVDLAHAAGSEGADDLVHAESLTWFQPHMGNEAYTTAPCRAHRAGARCFNSSNQFWTMTIVGDVPPRSNVLSTRKRSFHTSNWASLVGRSNSPRTAGLA